MNMKKSNIVITILLGIALALCCLATYFKINKEKITPEMQDHIKFSEEYTNVPEDNVFVYKNIDEIIKVLEHGTGIVYLGFPGCQWCQAYVPLLNEFAKESDIDKIYYCNILEDRKNNTEEYQKIVSILKDNLLYDQNGDHRIYVPDVTVVLNGTILGHDNESSLVTAEDGTPTEYWTAQRIDALREKYHTIFAELNQDQCTSCDE